MVLLQAAAAPAVQPHTITVSAGDYERTGTVVSFVSPVTQKLELRGSDGQPVPLQMDAQGNAVFVEKKLNKGETKLYQLWPARPSSVAHAEARPDGKVVKLSVEGKPALQYQTDPSEVPSPDIPTYFRHGAYLHPILTPGGKLVTDDYPSDHRWHRGIWLAWTHTEFEGRTPDFWNMGKDNGKFTGEVRFAKLMDVWSGPVHSGFRALHDFIDHTGPQPVTALNEEWTVTVYDLKPHGMPAWVFDLESKQICAVNEPLKLPKYHYGGLGFRGNRQWEEKDNFFILTSDGETDRKRANDNRCRWIDLSGRTDGELCGVAILCHPDNFRAPQPVRVNPKNPQTCNAPSSLGDWEIPPGKPYVSRYRIVVHDGPPNAAELDRLWNDYAHPPTVKVD